MEYLALPRARRVEGAVRVPPSKSATNRALVLAAISGRPVEIVRPLESGDTNALLQCLRAMGARVGAAPEGFSLGGPLCGNPSEEIALDAAESGTAARFLAALAAVTPGRFRLDGSARLRERPMAELIEALRRAGAEIRCLGKEGFLPLSITGSALRPSAPVVVDAERSSQFFSALLLAGAAVEGGLAVRPAGGVASRPYVEATIETLTAFGHTVRREADGIAVFRGRSETSRYEVPGDDSSAVPILAAVGVVGGRVAALGIRAGSRAADVRALTVLEQMGIAFEPLPDGVGASYGGGPLRPVRVEAADFPDSVPVLAALAALAEGESRFDGIGHLRYKESDRLASLVALVAAAGGTARAEAAALVVVGGISRGALAILPTCGDHRVAMAAALVAIARGDCLIENPDCVAKSYPDFFRDLTARLRF